MPRPAAKTARKTASGNKLALITGASRGIGAALASEFARGGYDLVLVARNGKQLRELAAKLERDYGRKITTLAVDLAGPGAAQGLFTEVERRGMTVEVLVNNVGLLSHGEFTDIPLENYQRLVNLNISVLTGLTWQFLKPMRERGSGRVLNVASLSAFMPVPQLAVYAASKAYVVSLSEALFEELKGTGVTVTALCPGFVSTDMVGETELELPGAMLISPERVAKEAYRACMKGVAVHVPGLSTRLGARIGELQPRSVRRLAGGMMSRFLLGKKAG